MTLFSPASYTLSKEEKKSMFECLSSVKVQSGYSSNIKGILNLQEKKLTTLKSHDCHVLMTELLPIVLLGILPEHAVNHREVMCLPQYNFSKDN